MLIGLFWMSTSLLKMLVDTQTSSPTNVTAFSLKWAIFEVESELTLPGKSNGSLSEDCFHNDQTLCFYSSSLQWELDIGCRLRQNSPIPPAQRNRLEASHTFLFFLLLLLIFTQPIFTSTLFYILTISESKGAGKEDSSQSEKLSSFAVRPWLSWDCVLSLCFVICYIN